jgi:hypothetical protein
MKPNSDQPSAHELRQRAQRHRWMATMVSDERASEALRVMAAEEAEAAAGIEREG